MPYIRMPGARPNQYVVVTIHTEADATISIFGAPEDPAPIQHLEVQNALALAGHMAEAHGFPLYVSASDDSWNPAWGRLTDGFVPRYR